MPKLTLSMIVKNEEKYLRECLESVKTIVDEIVVVDTGSIDNTIKIAEEYGAKVYNFNWVNDFSAARNFALKHSHGQWILYLDADERLTSNSIHLIKQAISKNGKIGYFCNVVSRDSVNGAPNSMRYARLFKNSNDIEFTGRIHEQIIYSLEERGYKLKNSNITIDHIGYDVSFDVLKQKASRNLSYLLLDYKDTPNAYNAFQLAQTYSILGNRKEAVNYFSIVSEMKNIPSFYKAHAYRYLASHHLHLGDLQTALSLAQKGEKYDAEQPLLNMVTAKIYMNMGDYKKAIHYCQTALKVNHKREEKDFEIFVDNKPLLFLGLQIASLDKNGVAFNQFFEQLKVQYEDEVNNNYAVNVVKLLFNNEGLKKAEIEMLPTIVDKSNLEFFIYLIERQADIQLKSSLYEVLVNKIDNDANLLNSYGQFLTSINKDQQAVSVFEKSISIELIDPSTIFFLISLYVKLGEVEKINQYLILAENKFSNFPVVLEKIKILKEQLSVIN